MTFFSFGTNRIAELSVLWLSSKMKSHPEEFKSLQKANQVHSTWTPTAIYYAGIESYM